MRAALAVLALVVTLSILAASCGGNGGGSVAENRIAPACSCFMAM